MNEMISAEKLEGGIDRIARYAQPAWDRRNEIMALAAVVGSVVPPSLHISMDIPARTPEAVVVYADMPEPTALHENPRAQVIHAGLGRSVLNKGKSGVMELPSAAECGQNFYVLEPGDTLNEIAAICGISRTDIARWNKHKFPDMNNLPAGESVYLKDPAVIYAPKPEKPPTPEVPIVEHEIKPGDTFSGIAGKYGLSLSKLINNNCLPPSLVAVVGQKVRIDGNMAGWCTPELQAQRKAEWDAAKNPPPPPTTLPPATTVPPVPETTLPPTTATIEATTTTVATTTTRPTTTTSSSPTSSTRRPLRVQIVDGDEVSLPDDLSPTARYSLADVEKGLASIKNDNKLLIVLPPLEEPEPAPRPIEPVPVATPVVPVVAGRNSERRSGGDKNTPSGTPEVIPDDQELPVPSTPIVATPASGQEIVIDTANAEQAQALETVLHPERITYGLEHNNFLNQEIKVTPEGYKKFLESIDKSHAGFYNDVSGTNTIDINSVVVHWMGGECNGDIMPCANAMKGRGLSVQYMMNSSADVSQLTQTPTTLAFHALGVNRWAAGIEVSGSKIQDWSPEVAEAIVYWIIMYVVEHGVPLSRNHIYGHSETSYHNDDPRDYPGRKIDPPPETMDVLFRHAEYLYALMGLGGTVSGTDIVQPVVPNDGTSTDEDMVKEPDYDEWFFPSSNAVKPEELPSAAEIGNDPFESLLDKPVTEPSPPYDQEQEEPIPEAADPVTEVVVSTGPMTVAEMGQYPNLQHATQNVLDSYNPEGTFNWQKYHELTASTKMDIAAIANILAHEGAAGEELVDLTAAALLETKGYQGMLGVEDLKDPTGENVSRSQQPIASVSVSVFQHNIPIEDSQDWAEAERLLIDTYYAARQARNKYAQRGLDPWHATWDEVKLAETRIEVRNILGL